MRSQEGLSGRLVLVACNVAGMVDLVALPLWVGSLMQGRGLGAQQAGMLVTCYILGVFASSLFFAPRLTRLNNRVAAACGFVLGAAGFLGLAGSIALPAMVGLHLLAGLGAGCGLSFTHGTIGRSSNPHRVFAMAGFGTGVFAILFFAALPPFLAAHGPAALFLVLAALLLLAAVLAAVAFPVIARRPEAATTSASLVARPSTRTLAFIGVACIATTQAMIFGFIERIGIAHGFAPQQVGLMLILGGFANLTAPILASVLDRRLSKIAVATFVVPLHAMVGAAAVLAPSYLPYAVCGIVFVWLIIFGHTFMFSLIARLDPSGRTVATTPAMLMIGSAIGPILGGTLVEMFGYPALAPAALLVAAVGTVCFLAIWRDTASPAAGQPLLQELSR